MAVTSRRNIQVEFSGDIVAEVIKSAAENVVSPGMEVIQTLAAGNNTITAPVISGIIVTGLTIFPPAANTSVMTLKGVNGDTGFPLHLTDPISISLGTAFTSLVINAVTQIVGLRLVWS